MRVGLRSLVAATAVAAMIPIVTGADSTPATARSEVQLQLGDLLFGDERYFEAAIAFERAKQGASDRQLVRALMGEIRAFLRVAQFLRVYHEATSLRALAPRNPVALALFGDAVWAAGRLQEAEPAYKDALALNPDEARARHGLARSLAARSRLADAMTELQAALALTPTESEFHHTLSSIYRRMHQFPEAADALEQYARLVPNSQDSEKAEWARADARLLRSFGDRVPYEIEDGPDRLHTVPFRMVNEKAIVRGRVNGQSPIDFVLDTGAEHTVLSQRAARRIGIRPVTLTVTAGVGAVGLRGLQVGRLDSLQVGTLKVNNVPVLIKSPQLGGLPTREAESFSPLALGLSMTVDYRNNHVIIGRTVPEEPADIELPMRMHRLAIVRGVVNGEPKSFVVDTGGEVISISFGTASTLPHTDRHIPLRVYGTSGWDPDAYLLPGVTLAFDTIEYPNWSVVVLNLHRPSALLGFHIGGTVGHKFLRNYRVSIDLTRSVVRLNEF